MDRWDDEEAFRVARDLHSDAGVSAIHQTSTTANCGLASAPMAALDALVETAWSFPGFRVSYGAFEGPRAIRFHTSAGAESQAALDGVRLDLSDAPRFVEVLRTADTPVSFEDVRSDSRARPLAEAFEQVDARSLLILPLRRGRESQPFGVVMMDRAAARTWGPKEGAALDRLGPLIALTLEHVEACAELESAKASASRHERRVTAIRGLTAGVALDAERILAAISSTLDSDRDATLSLVGQLERIVDELERVQRGPSRLTEPFDLASVLDELAPSLRALTPADIRIEGLHRGPLGVHGNRTGIERLLVNLVAHNARTAHARQTLSLQISAGEGSTPPRLIVRGDALIDDALTRMVGGEDPLLSSEPVDPGLWQARCEALVLDIRLSLEGDALVLEFPAATLQLDPAQNAG